MADMRPPPSPDASTYAIRGASSAGWSPQRSPRKAMTANGASTPSDIGSEAQASPNRMGSLPEHRANLGALRSHGLVSNSIFKSSANVSPSSNASSPASSRMRSPTSPQRFAQQQPKVGVGLGISAQSTSPVFAAGTEKTRGTSNGTFVRSTSNSSFGSQASDEENERGEMLALHNNNSPRKSTNYRRLEQKNYVSNSPFRRTGNPSTFSPRDQTSANETFELPNNAWAQSAAAQVDRLRSTKHENYHQDATPTRETAASLVSTDVDRPHTPEQTAIRLATAHDMGEDIDAGTPTSAHTPRTQRTFSVQADSPTRSGLLVSNRLLGPRQMDGGSTTNSPHESPSKRERRKTVTFDEVLDVQEFDRESSFDHESLRSGSSEASSIHSNGQRLSRDSSAEDDEAMWLREQDEGAQKVVERLMVINGSPESHSSAFSTPELAVDVEQSRFNSRPDRQQQAQTGTSGDCAADTSSNDSQELSSVDEPRSPLGEGSDNEEGNRRRQDAHILDADAADLSGGNLSAYGALHRVESMVDELLGDEMLDGHQYKQASVITSPVASLRHQKSFDESHESPPRRRRGGASTTNAAKLGSPSKVSTAQAGGDLQAHSKASSNEQQQTNRKAHSTDMRLSLPAWSPLINADLGISTPLGKSPDLQISSGQQSRTTSGRPHISRDAVLQRVAREKKLLQDSQAVDSPEHASERQVDASQTSQAHQMATGRRSEPERRQASNDERKEDMSRNLQSTTLASPSKENQRHSPLDRLSAAAVNASSSHVERESTRSEQASGSKDGESSVDGRQRTWFDDASGEYQEELLDDEESATRKTDQSKRNRRPQSCLLDATLPVEGSEFESGLQRELSRIYRQGDSKYRVKDRGVYASAEGRDPSCSTSGKTSSTSAAIERTEGGKAWRKLRRPSDMNEYAKEMREYRANENPKKMTGKVFVMVDSFTPTHLPVPSRPTRFFCILDNGLHVVRTATSGLRPSGTSKIGQEFELIQHKNLAFSLTLVAQRDSHLQEPVDSPPSPTGKRDRMTPSFSRGVGKLFSSPKKRSNAAGSSGTFGQSTNSLASTQSSTGGAMLNGQQEPMLAFLNREGAFGQSKVVFERVANDCLAKCLVLDLPVHGVANPPTPPASTPAPGNEAPGKSPMPRSASLSAEFAHNLSKVRGTLRLKLFYLPPLPGIAKSLLPENLSQCIKGMDAARWHANQPSIEGTLTQLGGDCQSWRRRPVKVQGVYLIGFNEITKKATVKIDLGKAVSIEENKDPVKSSATGAAGANDGEEEELDETYHVERSFRITFKDGERIFYFADTDEEMHMWLNALGKVIGNGQASEQCAWAQVAVEMLKAKST